MPVGEKDMTVNDDEFGLAFDEGEVEEVAESTATAETAEAEKGVSSESVAESIEKEPTQEGETEGSVESETEDYHQLYEKEQQRLRSFDGRYKKEKEGWVNEREQLLNDLEALKSSARQEPETQQPSQEDEFLSKFKADYGEDVQKAVSLIAKQEAEKLVQDTLAERIDPLQQTVQSQQVSAHFQKIAQVHPDYEDVAGSEEFRGWIDAQPSYLSKIYEQITQSGSSEDVTGLLTAYKETLKPQEDTKRSQKAAAAAAVPARRGTMPKAEAAMDDFDSAWDEAPD